MSFITDAGDCTGIPAAFGHEIFQTDDPSSGDNGDANVYLALSLKHVRCSILTHHMFIASPLRVLQVLHLAFEKLLLVIFVKSLCDLKYIIECNDTYLEFSVDNKIETQRWLSFLDQHVTSTRGFIFEEIAKLLKDRFMNALANAEGLQKVEQAIETLFSLSQADSLEILFF